MNINASSEFSSIIDFVVHVFRSVIVWLDGIVIIGDSTSILDLNIAFTVFTIVFAAVFSVVRSGTVNSVDTVEASKKEAERRKQRQQRYNNKSRSKGG